MKKEPLYFQALVASWRLAWHHKMIWIFGFFTIFLGQMGLLELVTKVGLTGSKYAFFPKWLLLPEFVQLPGMSFAELSGMPIEGWTWLIWVVVILGGFGLVFLFVSVSSQGTLIHLAAQNAKSKKNLDIARAWQAGTNHFWRLLFLNLVKKIVILFLAIILGYATVNVILGGTVVDSWIFVLLFILSTVVGMVFSLLAIYAAAYVVVEDEPFLQAIESAWRLFLSHWLVSIEVAFIILFLNVVVGLVVLASFVLFFIPTLLLWLIAISIVSPMLYYVAIMIGVVLYLLFVVFAGTLLSIFTTSVWTYLFTKMHKQGIVSRILHWSGLHR